MNRLLKAKEIIVATAEPIIPKSGMNKKFKNIFKKTPDIVR